MGKVFSFQEIIDIFGGAPEFARQVHIPNTKACNMYTRNSINGRYFNRIVKAAQKAGYQEITHEALCLIAEASLRKRVGQR